MQTQLIGILNLTPDSFSDGGCYSTVEKALAQAGSLIENGAAILDIGAESTRPGATPITAEEEWQRLEAPLKAIRQRWDSDKVLLSIDTYHAETAVKVIAMGADIINDVSGCDSEAMRKVIAGSKVHVIIMHNMGVPADKNSLLPEDVDPVHTVMEWADRKFKQLESVGISRERVIFDPGIGFGKNAAQSIGLLRSIKDFQQLGVRLCVGHSRKSFLERLSAYTARDRDIETIAVSLYLSTCQVEYLRVHDVEGHRRALKAFGAMY